MSKRILIVDDERHVRTLLETALEVFEDYDVEVGSHESAEAAERAIGVAAPDLVVLDLSMPDASGLDLCRRIRSAPETRGTRVVMLAEKAEEADRERCLAAGADEFVVKPFDPDLVIGAVARILEIELRG
jgi:CheY-like chemotaxis protein